MEELVRRASDHESKPELVRQALACCDVTSLETDDTPERIAGLAKRALNPTSGDVEAPHAAALCTWIHLLPAAKEVLSGSAVKLAAVAGDFPAGRTRLEDKIGEITAAVQTGADEIDAVMNRSAIENGLLEDAYEEVSAFRHAAPRLTLKVILETGELRSADLIRRAALVALAAGADMVKTSTGKAAWGASLEAAAVMLEVLRDFEEATGRAAGLKVAGGIRRTDQALSYMTLVAAALGPAALSPRRFRIGASALLDDLVKAL